MDLNDQDGVGNEMDIFRKMINSGKSKVIKKPCDSTTGDNIVENESHDEDDWVSDPTWLRHEKLRLNSKIQI